MAQADAWKPVDESAWKPVDDGSAPAPAPQQSSMLGDFAKGVGKGIIHTMSSADDLAAKYLPAFMTTPIGQAATPENSARAVQAAKLMAVPHNTAQSIGRGLEQAGEFLIPGGAEETAAKSLAPTMGKVGGRIIASTLGSAAVNKAQGGSAFAGGVAGTLGAGIGAGLSAIAPTIAEKAIGVRAVDRAFGRTPGQAILAETKGVNPGTIASQAADKADAYTNELEDAARTSPTKVDLAQPRATHASFQQTADLQNNSDTIRDVQEIGRQLSQRQGIPIPQHVPAYEGLALKRGLSALTQYNPNAAGGLADAAVKGTVKSMEPGLEAAIPDYADLNSRISSLIPVAKRAGATDLNENLVARALGRFGKPTGALIGATAGAGEGYRETKSVGGAAVGGLLGLMAPEVLANPTTLMMGARAMTSPATNLVAIPGLTGAAMQFGRKKPNE